MPAREAHYADRLVRRVDETRSVLCVGLDPRGPFPAACTRGLRAGRAGTSRAMERYAITILDAVAPYAAAVKPQVAFFEALGGYGITALERVCAHAASLGVIVIADAKRGDIASTAEAYARSWVLARSGDEAPVADAVTVNPYLGRDSLEPFLAACADDRGMYVLVRTSNPGSADLQGLQLAAGGEVWERVAAIVASVGEPLCGQTGLSAVGAVFGLTQPALLGRARSLMPRTPLLLPGFGAQGGDPRDAAAAFTPHPAAGLVAASRSVIEAWRAEPGDWHTAVARAAREHRDTLWRVVVDATG
jgi:orotidine-5'-phosphate decarboxylase